MSNDANWSGVDPEQKVNTSETDMLAECQQADPDFYDESLEYVYRFSNGRRFKVPKDEN
jgi:hypothetical protein